MNKLTFHHAGNASLCFESFEDAITYYAANRDDPQCEISEILFHPKSVSIIHGEFNCSDFEIAKVTLVDTGCIIDLRKCEIQWTSIEGVCIEVINELFGKKIECVEVFFDISCSDESVEMDMNCNLPHLWHVCASAEWNGTLHIKQSDVDKQHFMLESSVAEVEFSNVNDVRNIKTFANNNSRKCLRIHIHVNDYFGKSKCANVKYSNFLFAETLSMYFGENYIAKVYDTLRKTCKNSPEGIAIGREVNKSIVEGLDPGLITPDIHFFDKRMPSKEIAIIPGNYKHKNLMAIAKAVKSFQKMHHSPEISTI
ncbi:hypothetical protein [Chitinilyticum piscinae]|uniref:Uncharacterized protein n=1 Tax=Chitinilyticum piscinae TaxID=2866724 RepID=A0A8J7G2Y6_9NEIS|nr:hypothetical protein [Chitinilyticum piscinae]MBE9611030.1 hypothetical protein [Chitinilyticum piscinae]